MEQMRKIIKQNKYKLTNTTINIFRDIKEIYQRYKNKKLCNEGQFKKFRIRN